MNKEKKEINLVKEWGFNFPSFFESTKPISNDSISIKSFSDNQTIPQAWGRSLNGFGKCVECEREQKLINGICRACYFNIKELKRGIK